MAEKLGKQIEEEERKKMEREKIVHELYLAEKENELANEVVKLAQDKKRIAKELLQYMVKLPLQMLHYSCFCTR